MLKPSEVYWNSWGVKVGIAKFSCFCGTCTLGDLLIFHSPVIPSDGISPTFVAPIFLLALYITLKEGFKKLNFPFCQALCPFCVCVSVCQLDVCFVSVCLKVQKWTHTDTKVTFHPLPENFFWSQIKGMAKIRLSYSGDMALILPQ